MSPPRRILPGTTYLLTRRCYQRAFRLRPSEDTNQIFAYCLALAAERTGVKLHAVCVMSNHHHVVLTDVEGRVPEFARELHRMTSKVLNARQGRWESLWSAEPYHLLTLGAEDDVVDKIAYVTANPVAAGLVAAPSEWPGLLRSPGVGQADAETIRRPTVYFRERSRCPARVELRVAPYGMEGFGERVAAAIARRVADACEKARAMGWTFLGAANVMKSSFAKRARSFEARRQTAPSVAAKSMFLRQAMLESIRAFRTAYRAALDRWRARNVSVEFPEGTWWMRVFHNAQVATGSALAPD